MAFLLLECSSPTRVPYAVVSPPRDWAAYPAVVERDAPPTLYAMSDVHGGYDLCVRHDGDGEIAESLDPEGSARELWRGP